MSYKAEINEYAALLDTPEAQAVLAAEEWPPLASVPVPMLPMLFRQNKSRPMHVVPWGPM